MPSPQRVAPISDDGVLELLLGAETVRTGADETRASHDPAALRGALARVRAGVAGVALPRWAALLLRDARTYVREMGADGLGGGYISDRRLRRAADVLRASAAAHGRRTVGVVDALAALPHVLWDDPDEAGALAEWVEEHALPDGGAEQLRYLLDAMRARAAAAADDERADSALEEDARALAAAAAESAAEMRAHEAALEQARDHLFLPPQQAAGVRQRLLPEARERAGNLESLARAAAALEAAVAERLDAAGLAAVLDELGGSADAADSAGPEEASARVEQQSFSEDELAWGRKEAKSRLGAEEFRAWRRAVKKASKQNKAAT